MHNTNNQDLVYLQIHSILTYNVIDIHSICMMIHKIILLSLANSVLYALYYLHFFENLLISYISNIIFNLNIELNIDLITVQ